MRVIIALAAIILLAIGCSTVDDRSPVPVHAQDIWDDFQSNNSYAKNKYNEGRWAIEVPRIHQIDDSWVYYSPNCHIPHPNCLAWESVVLDYANEEDVWELRPGDSAKANCRYGSDFAVLGKMVRFKDCRTIGTGTDAFKPTATPKQEVFVERITSSTPQPASSASCQQLSSIVNQYRQQGLGGDSYAGFVDWIGANASVDNEADKWGMVFGAESLLQRCGWSVENWPIPVRSGG